MDAERAFGHRLSAQRHLLDLSQDELARRAGCAIATIRQIEQGNRKPSKQLAERLADVLLVPTEERVRFINELRGLNIQNLPDSSLQITTLPTGNVTFLFSDIEASTTRWKQHPKAMREALIRHNAIWHDAVSDNGGVIFKTVGDAICAAFSSASNALTAALAAQHALHAESWGILGSLLVRVALHTGVAESYDGDYIGLPLSHVARLLSAGHGGQILLSQATTELIRDHLHSGVELWDLGKHSLKDLGRPEHIFQVVTPNLPHDFPALKTLDTYPNNLPAQPTALIGREQEATKLRDLLLRGDVRLLTVTGMGGAGKTRLALQVASDLLDAFDDGVYWVSLAPISDSELVIPTIAQTLSIREAGGQLLIDNLKTYLREKHLLLVLDNFEQVLAAAPSIAELLTAAPQLKILITSRAILHIYSEHEFPVPPLAQDDAVRLFCTRAQAAQVDFTITRANAPAVTKLCARLDGLPLAIELAAARVRLFSPQALLVRLERSHGSSLQLLIDGPRDMPIRQQTLRNTIDWSYNLLGADEQTLFARLGVFVGGCTLEAVEAICIPDADLPSDVVHIIASLIEQSLVQLEEGEDGEPRFLMLETIREYALDRLEARGKAAVLQRRHAEYFCSLAESAEEPLYGPQAMAWANRLASEHNNLRAALRWALNQREIDIVGRTSGALHTFWSSSGYFSEGQQWQEMALKHGEQLLQLLRAKLLFQAGNLALAQGYYQEAAALSEAGLALARPFEDNPILVTALNMLGLVVLHREDIVQAEALFNEALTLARVHGNTRGSALALVYLSVIRLMQGDLTQAGKLAAESRLLFQQVEYTRYLALNIIVLGAITLFQGDIDKAMIMATEGLVLLQEVNEKQFMVYCLDLMAMIATARGQFVHATRLMGSANMLRETIGLRRIWGIELLVKRTVGTVQAHLDAAVFEAAWMEGRAMSLQQAITYTVTDSY